MSVDTSTISTDAPVPSPCKDDTADLILRSSDGVDFRAHKFILSAASTFFEGLLSVPQPPSTSTSTEEIGIVPFDLEHLPLSYLIRLCYPDPADTAGIDSLSAIESVLRAAHKYDLSVVTARLETVYLCIGRKQIEEEPAKAFVTACQYRWSAVARLAADSCLMLRMDDLIKKISETDIHCEASDLQQLYRYHLGCRESIRAACEKPCKWEPHHGNTLEMEGHARSTHILLGLFKAFDVAYSGAIRALGVESADCAPMEFIHTIGINISTKPVDHIDCWRCRVDLKDSILSLIQDGLKEDILQNFNRETKLTFSWDR
ncbi:hypothetical protein ONZ45_g9251 [Pleurotus djamor]|nr:hypothetical protein ONZ45_g9251 [Pleurotus djamor]